MEIKLLIKDKEKTFSVPFVSARKLREALEVTKTVNLNDFDPEGLDKAVAYTVDLFKNQFSMDDLYDGIASHEIVPEIARCIGEVIHGKPKPKND